MPRMLKQIHCIITGFLLVNTIIPSHKNGTVERCQHKHTKNKNRMVLQRGELLKCTNLEHQRDPVMAEN